MRFISRGRNQLHINLVASVVTTDATKLICKYMSVGNTSARTSLPPDNVVWFIIYQIISDIIVLIKRYATVETKHSTPFQFRYSSIKHAVNCGLSLRHGASWIFASIWKLSARTTRCRTAYIIRTTQVYRRTLFPCLIQCPWTMSSQRLLLGLSSDIK